MSHRYKRPKYAPTFLSALFLRVSLLTKLMKVAPRVSRPFYRREALFVFFFNKHFHNKIND